MKLSVIVPVYNTEKYLNKCVDSLLDTSFQDYEILLVDDGSTDGSPAMIDALARLHPDVIRAIHQENTGPGGARNNGIRSALGQFILFIDSDDYLTPQALDRLVPCFDLDFDICIFDALSVRETGEMLQYLTGSKNRKPETLKDTPTLLLEMPAVWNKVFRKSLFTDHAIHFPDKAWSEDVRTVFKVYLHAEHIITLPEPLYNYVQRGSSIMHSSNCKRNLEIIDAINELSEYYRAHDALELYQNELEYVAFEHQLITASVRVAMADAKSPVLDQLREDFFSKYPDYSQNPYIQQISFNRKLPLLLIRSRHYGILRLIMRLNEKIKRG